MKTLQHVKFLVPALLFLFTVASLAEETPIPKGWFPAGTAVDKFTMAVDHAVTRNNKPSATVHSTDAGNDDVGTLMQVISAEKYLGKRVRLSGWIKTRELKNWGGMWLRINGEKPEEPLAFDNMMNRPLRGTLDWTNCAVVLDVPNEAKVVAYGLLLNGAGQVWLNGVKVEVVGNDVAITGGPDKAPVIPTEPENLEFK